MRKAKVSDETVIFQVDIQEVGSRRTWPWVTEQDTGSSLRPLLPKEFPAAAPAGAQNTCTEDDQGQRQGAGWPEAGSQASPNPNGAFSL